MYRTVEKPEGGTQLEGAGVDGRLTFKLEVIKRFCRPRSKWLRTGFCRWTSEDAVTNLRVPSSRALPSPAD